MTKTRKRTILVIEDEVMLLQAIAKKLEVQDYEAITATTGRQALDYLESLPELPDVIWLDFYLGEDMNGLDVMNKLKANDEWSQIPVVVVSNSASDEKVKNMLALGAKKYLLKAEHKLEELVKTFDEFFTNDQKEN